MTDHTVQDPGKLARSGQTIADQSAVLGKELGLRDLVLTQVLFVVGLGWIGTAAKVGPSHIVFWLLAISLFYLPCAAVVIYLTRLMPLEGGLYQWAKLGFNDFIGFLVAWNLRLYVIVNSSEVGLQVSTYMALLGKMSFDALGGFEYASGIFYALTYLAMFALPIAGLRTRPHRAPLWLAAAACSGFVMTLLYVVLSVFPIVAVGNQWLFTAKITLVILACNGVGAAVFLTGTRRRRARFANDL